jgi:tRNA(Ile2) C34 agmatinyltransferase TiaS
MAKISKCCHSKIISEGKGWDYPRCQKCGHELKEQDILYQSERKQFISPENYEKKIKPNIFIAEKLKKTKRVSPFNRKRV